MPIELELPNEVEATAGRAEPDADKEAKKDAAADALDSQVEPQRDGSTPVTIRLTKPVEDPVSQFAGAVGDTLDGYVDTLELLDGATWLPLADGDIMLEAEEFEVVEALPSQEETVLVAAESTAVAGPPELQPVYPHLPQTHEQAEQKRQRYFREKSALEEHICALGIEIGRAKETIKSCKKEQEVLLEKLDQLIQGWENPPAFESTSDPSGVGSGGGCDVTTVDQPAEGIPRAEPATTPEGPSSESYQSVLESESVAVLGLKEAVTEKLIEAGADTLWRLEMLRKDISKGRKEWPKGIGKAKVTAIEDAILAWCASNSGRWDRLQGANDQAEAAADVERAEAVKESQPVPNDIDDL